MNAPIRALVAVALCSAAIAADLPPGGNACPFAPGSTYEERVAASPRNKPLETDSLALPHPHAANVLPEPRLVKAGSHAVFYPDRDWIVWQAIPWQDIHQDYLAKRRELLEQKQAEALVDWCEQKHLPACAEFELRTLLLKFKSFQQPGYRPIVQRWLKYASRRQVDYSFPLPFNGTWHVSRDTTGHHAIKAGAAFAHDFVILKDGKPFSGTGRQLSDYYAWDQPILAQADGVVKVATDANPDMPIGKSGGFENANNLIVDYGGGILGLYGHVRQGSAKTRQGERVKAGQELARAGNSGASGMPHIHFTFLDHAHFSIRGRYRCEVQTPKGCQPLDGEDLKEGTFVRNKE
jgi:hypothetical protein